MRANVKREFNEHEKRLSVVNAVLTNMCMLQDAADRVLVQHRLPKKGNPWAGLTFPGGHVEVGESIVDSMVREFKEETGLTISGLTNCGYVQWFNPAEDSEYIIFCFKASAFTGELKSSAEGAMEWMSLEEMKHGPLAPNMEKYLEVFINPNTLQTYGEANCWDEVIKSDAAVEIVGL